MLHISVGICVGFDDKNRVCFHVQILSSRLGIRFAHCNRIVSPDGEMPFTRFDLSPLTFLLNPIHIITVIIVRLLVIGFRHFLGLKIDICKYYYGYQSFIEC